MLWSKHGSHARASGGGAAAQVRASAWLGAGRPPHAATAVNTSAAGNESCFIALGTFHVACQRNAAKPRSPASDS